MVDEVDDKTERSIRIRQTIRVVLIVAIAAVLLIWALANTTDTTVDWLFTETSGPLVAVIIVSAALGFVAGALAARRRAD